MALLGVECAHAATPCTASGIMAVEPACPDDPAQPCQIRSRIDAPPGDPCDLDFRGRDLVIGSADGPAGSVRGYGSIHVRARSLTLRPNGSINGRGDGGDGANFLAEIDGAVTLESQGIHRATIDVSAGGDGWGGLVEIEAGDTVTIDGILRGGKQLHASDIASASDIWIHSDRDIVGTGQILNPAGIYMEGYGEGISLDAAGRVDFAGTIDISGYATNLHVSAVDGVRLHDLDGAGGGIPSFGGGVEIESKGDVAITGNFDQRAIGGTDGDLGGEGGGLRIVSSLGAIVVSGKVRAGATGIFGIGGEIHFHAATDIVVEEGALVSLAAGNNEGYGGNALLLAARDISIRGDIDASGRNEGGDVEAEAGRHVVLDGRIDTSTPAGADETNGGSVALSAGSRGTGHLTLDGEIEANGGGCLYGSVYGGGGWIDLVGCDLTLGSGARIRSCGRSGGWITLTARREMTIAGEIVAPNVGPPGPDGKISLVHPDASAPQTALATFVPAPITVPRPSCSSPGQKECLTPCPECGDGVVAFPESCDTLGPPESCDGCNLFCQLEPATCADFRSCTVDTCHPTMGCRHEPVHPCEECKGDVDGNGAIDADDFAAVTWTVNRCGGHPFVCNVPGLPYGAVASADFDASGRITAADLNRMIAKRLDPALIEGCAP